MPCCARWTVPIAAVLFAGVCLADDDPEFRPLFDQARLIVSDEEFPPIEVIAPWHDFKQVGDRLFYTDGPRVVEVADDYTSVVNEVESTDGLDLVWLGNNEATAFFAPRRAEARSSDWDWRPEPVIRRLDLGSLSWIDPWDIELADLSEDDRITYLFEYDDDPEERPRHIMGHVVVHGDEIIALTLEVAGTEFEDERVLTFQIDAFRSDSSAPRWSRRFLSRDRHGMPIRSAPLYESWLPDELATSCTPLTVLDSDYRNVGATVLVCPGPTEDLLRLSIESGDEVDRIAALWEFEPGYPAVGEPFADLTRFGIDPEISRLLSREEPEALRDLTDAEWRKVDAYRLRRARFYEDNDPRIVAGPFLVPHTSPEADYFPYIVVVVDRARVLTDGWYLQQPDTVVYKIAERWNGEPLDVVGFMKLPLIPIGRQPPPPHASIVIDNSFLWWGRDASLARIDVNDMLLNWYRGNPTGVLWWEYHDPRNTPATSSRTVLFRAHDPRLQVKQKTIRVRMDAILVADGDGAEIEVHIPFSGEGRQFAFVSVHSLDTDGETLTLVVGTSSVTGRIQFELPPGLSDL